MRWPARALRLVGVEAMRWPVPKERSMCGRIAFVDYGNGKHLQHLNALRKLGASSRSATRPRSSGKRAGHYCPGWGPSWTAWTAWRAGTGRGPARFAATGTPVSGHLHGYAMMMDTGMEFGGLKGLGMIPAGWRESRSTAPTADRKRIPTSDGTVCSRRTRGPAGSLLADVAGSPVYFVHSFTDRLVKNGRNTVWTTASKWETIAAAVTTRQPVRLPVHPRKAVPLDCVFLRNFWPVVQRR